MTTAGATQTTSQATPLGAPPSRACHQWAFALWLVSLLLFYRPLAGLANLSLHDDNSSHLLVIPILSAIMVWIERKRVFRNARYSPIGLMLLLAVLLLWCGFRILPIPSADRLSVDAALLVLTWIAIFVLCYGAGSFKAAVFPLLYLGLMIPIPAAATYRLISFLQRSSADTSYVLFRLLGIPVLRHGFVFSLPGIDLEVARECSGIRSALSLFIAGLLAAHFVLPSAWRKIWFVAAILPIAIFKNAVRIVTLAWLGIYVNPAVFQSKLHRQGGVPFSIIALALMFVLLWVLRRPGQIPGGASADAAGPRLGIMQNSKPN